MRNAFWFGGVAALAVALVAVANVAAAKNWIAGTGNWNTPANWSPVGVPTAGEAVNLAFADGDTRTVTLNVNTPALGLLTVDLTGAGVAPMILDLPNGSSLTAAHFFVGGHNGAVATNGRGAVNQSSGAVATTVGSFVLAHTTGSTGSYTLSGSGQLLTSGDAEHIGLDGTGTFNQSGGSNTVSGTNLFLGTNPTGQGTYNLGAGSLTANNYEFIGYSGLGQFNQSGGTNTVTNLIIADRASGQGAYAISGGTLNVGNNAVVGLLGTAAMNITLTGAVNIANDLAINNTSNVTLNGGSLRLSSVSSGLNRLIWQSGTLQLAGDRHLNSDSVIGNFLGSPPSIGAGRKLVVEGIARVFGTATVNGGSLTSLGSLYVNDSTGDTSTFNIASGGIVTTNGAFIARGTSGQSNGPSAVANVSGTGSTWNTGPLEIGRAGGGALNVTGGATVVSSEVTMGVGSVTNDPVDTLVVSGPGSSLTSNSILRVGFNSDALVTVENGGLVNVGTELYIAPGNNVNVNGGTLRFDTLNFVGIPSQLGKINFNSGTIQLAGARNLGGDSVIQTYYGAIPTIPLDKGLTVEGAATLTKPLNIDGGTFKTNGLTVGAGGSLLFQSGVLEIGSGGTTGLPQLNIPTNGELRAVGTHTVRVAGAVGSTITPTGLLILGDFNAVNGFYTNGTVNIGANTLALTDANDAVLDSAALVTLGNGASPGQLDAINGLTLNFGANITGFGEVYTSNASFTPLINNGHITGTSSAQRITLPGYVKGVGTFSNVNFTGTFAPGLSPTSLQVGNVGLSSTSTLLMELGGTTPGSGYDQLISSGAIDFNGTLQVTLINSFNPAAGQSFNLFDWAAASGTFASLSLPALGGGLSWNTSQLYTTGVLSVSAGVSGDFDHDGDVDGNDFLVWQRGGSPTPNSSADLAIWKTNFGFAGANPAAAAVPEPSSLPLFVSTLSMLFSCRRLWRFRAFD